VSGPALESTHGLNHPSAALVGAAFGALETILIPGYLFAVKTRRRPITRALVALLEILARGGDQRKDPAEGWFTSAGKLPTTTNAHAMTMT